MGLKDKAEELKDKAQARSERIEGRVQEMMGELDNDPQDKAEGQAKQVNAGAENTLEDIEEKMNKKTD
ncbi:CsbD-like protein [Stanieria sp. NIES-3757]|nr:CsbD-like protein [Stanieria sp. NIES-3757]